MKAPVRHRPRAPQWPWPGHTRTRAGGPHSTLWLAHSTSTLCGLHSHSQSSQSLPVPPVLFVLRRRRGLGRGGSGGTVLTWRVGQTAVGSAALVAQQLPRRPGLGSLKTAGAPRRALRRRRSRAHRCQGATLSVLPHRRRSSRGHRCPRHHPRRARPCLVVVVVGRT